MNATILNARIRVLECQLDTASKADLLYIASELVTIYEDLATLYCDSA